MRVLPDVSALDRTFDYTVTAEERARIDLGTMVRVELHGRRIGGWIVGPRCRTRHEPAAAAGPQDPRPGTDRGPDRAGRLGLVAVGGAAPPVPRGRVPRAGRDRAAPHRARRRPPPDPGRELAAEALSHPVAVLRLPPAVDRAPVALAAAALGNTLLLTPTQADAQRLAGRLRRAGVQPALAPDGWAQGRAGATVVGTRAAAWAPMADLAAVVVFDEHDPALQGAGHARLERTRGGRRAGPAGRGALPAGLSHPIVGGPRSGAAGGARRDPRSGPAGPPSRSSTAARTIRCAADSSPRD